MLELELIQQKDLQQRIRKLVALRPVKDQA